MAIDKKSIGQRIKSALEKSKITQRQLAKELGISEPSVTAYIQGASNLPAEAYAVISDLCNVSIDWIVKGDDHLQRNHDASIAMDQVSKYQQEGEAGLTLPDDYIKTHVYLLGGAGSPHDLTTEVPIDTLYLPKRFAQPHIVPIKISGHSMEPFILNGAYVGVDREDCRVISGEVYAVNLPYEGTVIKRIYMSVDSVLLKSENAAFPDLSIPIEKIDRETFVLGRVKWVLQEI